MKYFAQYSAMTLLFVLVLLPATATARSYRDGSNEATTTRQQWIREYRQQSSELQQKINALPSTANQSVFMPVLFGVGVKDISPNFGDIRDGGARTHEGEDIMAVKGTPIVSPTPAVVLRTGVGSGEGNYVYTANPGGETFVYMHLDRLGEGVVSGLVLAQGSLVGYVGNTGNASGGPAHLHFEIHNNSNVPVDPFPRLTSEFSLQEKMSHLSTILLQNTDSATLARLLVTNFRGTFLNALAANVILPIQIIDTMASIPVVPVSGGTLNTLPAGDLDIGSSGVAVTALQKYLIQADSGVASTRLSGTGATGYFGIITKAALMEYQVLVGIAPPSGYYGPTTRMFIEAHPLAVTPPPTSGNGTALTRNLYYGISGSDVLTLQKILNANGFIVATSGAGSAGNETIYFGSATRTAVIKFQLSHGITPAVGYVGSITRTALASL
ncbi:MAG: peptidoglycan-binding protein [Patescibacteria group bacterium]